MSYDNSKHTALIAELVASGCTVRGFRRRLVQAVAGDHRELEHEEDDCDHCLLREMTSDGKVVPDAHRIDEENLEVHAYEVEVSHATSEYKLSRYVDWYWALDEFEWVLRLFIVDRFGHVNEIDLLAYSLPRSVDIKAYRAFAGIRAPGEPPRPMEVP